MRLLTPRRELLVPLIDIPWHAGTPSARDVHTESGNAVPLRVITPNQRVFSAENLPPSLYRKKPASDFLNINPFPICSPF
jgi:hypothetical protein